MKLFSLVCAILFCFQHTQAFQISLTVGDDQSISSVQATGQVQHGITNDEKDAFGLNDAALYGAIANSMDGRGPDDYAFCDPTDNGNQYQNYGWQAVTTTLTAISAQIISQTTTPVALRTTRLQNNGSFVGTFHADMSDDVETSVTSSWDNTISVGLDQTIDYEIGFAGTGVGGSTSVSFHTDFQQGGSSSQKTTIGTQEGVNIRLQPGQKVDAVLSGSQGLMTVQVTYQASIDGCVYFHYNNGWEDHFYRCYPVGNFASQTSMTATETITINYYSAGEVSINDVAE